MSRTKNLLNLIATYLCLISVYINGEIKNWEKDMTNEVYIEASHEGFEEVIIIIQRAINSLFISITLKR